ncbi:MAG: hypothetical protein PHO12_05065 [Bacteroidales bacterium]|nr:hypothetical protein [Bacteroidales bacterium]MDD4684949.1 hypothetical protein [Bacteroidales bacterium]
MKYRFFSVNEITYINCLLHNTNDDFLIRFENNFYDTNKSDLNLDELLDGYKKSYAERNGSEASSKEIRSFKVNSINKRLDEIDYSYYDEDGVEFINYVLKKYDMAFIDTSGINIIKFVLLHQFKGDFIKGFRRMDFVSEMSSLLNDEDIKYHYIELIDCYSSDEEGNDEDIFVKKPIENIIPVAILDPKPTEEEKKFDFDYDSMPKIFEDFIEGGDSARYRSAINNFCLPAGSPKLKMKNDNKANIARFLYCFEIPFKESKNIFTIAVEGRDHSKKSYKNNFYRVLKKVNPNYEKRANDFLGIM